MQDFDASSKWLIQSHGDALLRLAGLRGIASWKAVQAEPVHPRRLPDGLIEARRRGRPRLLVVPEVSTYAYGRLARQAADDALLVSLVRGEVPEVVVLVLRPRGRKPSPRELVLRSAGGTTTIRVEWRVVELWKVPATELLAADDIGLVPLVPLAAIDGPTEPILDECRERILRTAPEEEQKSLLAAIHFFAGLKYNDPRLFQRLGGNKAMLKTGSPLLREIVGEETRKARSEARRETTEEAIIAVLKGRFGPEAEVLSADLKAVSNARLQELLALTGTSPDLATFHREIAPRRRKRRG